MSATEADEAAWRPSVEEVQRALKEAGVIHLSNPVHGPACSHNNPSLYECPECRKAILDYERQQGREPTSPDAKYKPTRYERMRAWDAGVIKRFNTDEVCSHNNSGPFDCPDCIKAILDYERQQGREPTDPEAWKADREKEIEEERRRAYKALDAALGPQVGDWHVLLFSLIPAGVVYCLVAYVSLPAGIAVATFCIIRALYDWDGIEARRRVALREAQRDVDEWNNIHKRFLDRLRKECRIAGRRP